MSAIELPDTALVLLFADDPATAERFAARWFGGLTAGCGVAARLAARGIAAVGVGGATRAELTALARAAVNAYARVYAIAIETDGGLMERRLGTISVAETFSVDEAASAVLALRPVSTDRRTQTGPFDIIGDVHGCADELIDLLGLLGYRVMFDGAGPCRRVNVMPPPGRRAFFAGDLVDRGPNSPDVLRIVMAMVAGGSALAVAGNHDASFLRWLDGHATQLKHGLEGTVAQFEACSQAFREEVRTFLAGLQGHLWVDGGALAVAHAGIAEAMIGRSTGRVRAFSLYGDTDTKKAADGLPMRYHWALDYRGETAVVYGHTPVADVAWVNNTACIDTGCCFGGRLTALRWPEREIVWVPARRTYATRGRPFGHPPPRPK